MLRLALLCLPLLLAPITRAQNETDWSKIDVKVTKVAGQVYVIEDAGPAFSGGNIGVSVGADGIVLVDDKFAPLAPKIQAALRAISDKPIRFVINTHYHDDHTGGNLPFGVISTIIAQENTRRRLMDDKDHPVSPAALPIVTFTDKLSIHLNGEDIRAIHFPNGHTDTDVVVFFMKSNVVHMGDDYFSGMFPSFDIDGGGSVKGTIANIEKLLTMIPADAKIIPGHGPVSNTSELRAYLTMLRETSSIVEAGIKAGKSADQLKKEKVLAKYDAWAHGYLDADAFIAHLYRALARK